SPYGPDLIRDRTSVVDDPQRGSDSGGGPRRDCRAGNAPRAARHRWPVSPALSQAIRVERRSECPEPGATRRGGLAERIHAQAIARGAVEYRGSDGRFLLVSLSE